MFWFGFNVFLKKKKKNETQTTHHGLHVYEVLEIADPQRQNADWWSFAGRWRREHRPRLPRALGFLRAVGERRENRLHSSVHVPQIRSNTKRTNCMVCELCFS